MPPQYVKAYVKRNKNDAADAEAICEAVRRPSMRFVAVKSAEQQAVLTMHRARDLLIRQRTMLVNALRAHLAEFGIVGAQGIHRLCDLVAIVADEEDERVPTIARGVLRIVADQIAVLQTGIAEIDGRILAWHRSSEVSLRLAGMPGVGPIVASAIASSVPDASVFHSAESSPPGWAWCRSSPGPAARRGWVGSASAATGICADCSSPGL